MMLLDAIATIILAGMMMVPLVNIVVGVILGAGLGGAFGGIAGLALALGITAAEKLIGDRFGWFDAIGAAEDQADLTQQVPDTAPQERLQLLRTRPLKLRKKQQSQRRRTTVPFAENTSQWLH
jgi:hypothetical protein